MAELEDILRVRETLDRGDSQDTLAMMSPQQAPIPVRQAPIPVRQAPMAPQQAPMALQQAPMIQQDLNKGMRGSEILSPARMPTDDEVNKGILMALIEKKSRRSWY